MDVWYNEEDRRRREIEMYLLENYERLHNIIKRYEYARNTLIKYCISIGCGCIVFTIPAAIVGFNLYNVIVVVFCICAIWAILFFRDVLIEDLCSDLIYTTNLRRYYLNLKRLYRDYLGEE